VYKHDTGINIERGHLKSGLVDKKMPAEKKHGLSAHAVRLYIGAAKG
jgi:hypothetical protein